MVDGIKGIAPRARSVMNDTTITSGTSWEKFVKEILNADRSRAPKTRLNACWSDTHQ